MQAFYKAKMSGSLVCQVLVPCTHPGRSGVHRVLAGTPTSMYQASYQTRKHPNRKYWKQLDHTPGCGHFANVLWCTCVGWSGLPDPNSHLEEEISHYGKFGLAGQTSVWCAFNHGRGKRDRLIPFLNHHICFLRQLVSMHSVPHDVLPLLHSFWWPPRWLLFIEHCMQWAV